MRNYIIESFCLHCTLLVGFMITTEKPDSVHQSSTLPMTPSPVNKRNEKYLKQVMKVEGGPGLLARDCRRLGADDTTRSPVCCEGQ